MSEIKKIVINGILGHMGRQVLISALAEPALDVVAGIDTKDESKIWEIPVYKDFSTLENIDLVIDFSTPNGMQNALEWCVENNVAFVSGTTGISDEQKSMLEEAGGKICVLWAPNMSPGINVTVEISKIISNYLPEYDIEIIERHHKRKKDAPSGTALSIVEEIVNNKKAPESKVLYGRDKGKHRREIAEVGVHSVRGGGVVGEHSIYLIGSDEEIVITHRAFSRQVFALGALKATFWLLNAENGYYEMRDTLKTE
ncbi:MAG: 4-hydroxy-tetrahydrodipicolinate reductase [Candidatus Zixiibacteriota bacterium]